MRIIRRNKHLQTAYTFALSFVLGSFLYAFFMAPFSSNAADGSAEVDLEIAPVISMGVSSDLISLDITPTRTGASKSGSTIATISTNNKTGYSLYINTDNDSLVHTDSAISDVISPILTAGSLADISSNTWGYSLNGTTFTGVPLASTKISSSTAPVYGKTTPLYVGAKADTNITAGTYAGTVKLTAVTNNAH